MKRSRNPRYLKQWCDPASGKWINQYRRKVWLVRLPNGRNFTDEFWKAYYEAECAVLGGEAQSPGTKRLKAGSVNAALAAFYRSGLFLYLAANTRRTIRTSLERDFRPVYGEARIAHLLPWHVAAIIDEKARTAPAGARVLLTALRAFTRYCLGAELLRKDPRPISCHRSTSANRSTPGPRIRSRNSRPAGRLAACRAWRSPCTSTPASGSATPPAWDGSASANGMIHITQQKTGTPVSIPIHPELQQILDAVPKGNLTFLLNANGVPFVHGYGARFREWCTATGPPDECTSHGLRKAACRRLAEVGCSVHEIAAISGHKTLSEIERGQSGAPRTPRDRRSHDQKRNIKLSRGPGMLDKTLSNTLKIKRGEVGA